MASYSVRAELFPTEDPAAVRNAILNIFPDSTIISDGNFLLCKPAEIDQLIRLVTEQKTRVAFVEEIDRKTQGNGFRMRLNKQAALAGRVNIADEPKPLGCIEFGCDVTNPVIHFEKLLDVVGCVSSKHVAHGAESAPSERV